MSPYSFLVNSPRLLLLETGATWCAWSFPTREMVEMFCAPLATEVFLVKLELKRGWGWLRTGFSTVLRGFVSVQDITGTEARLCRDAGGGGGRLNGACWLLTLMEGEVDGFSISLGSGLGILTRREGAFEISATLAAFTLGRQS